MDPETEETVVEQGAEEEQSDALRELVLRAYPDVVPELLSGVTVAEVLASVPAAQAAYARIVEQAAPAASEPAPSGGGGAARAFPLDVGAMSPALKIREGLRRLPA